VHPRRESVSQLYTTSTVDRRSKERVYIPFPATVEGIDAEGEAFKVDTVLDNLSRDGLYLRMIPCVDIGVKLSIIFRLSSAATVGGRVPRISVRGVVLRSEQKTGGACGVAVRFNPVRFI
jgi:hypothetical protein